MVGKTATVSVEEGYSVGKEGKKLFIGLDTRRFNIRNKGILSYFYRLVGTEGRKNLRREVSELFVIFESVERIVRRTDNLYV